MSPRILKEFIASSIKGEISIIKASVEIVIPRIFHVYFDSENLDQMESNRIFHWGLVYFKINDLFRAANIDSKFFHIGQRHTDYVILRSNTHLSMETTEHLVHHTNDFLHMLGLRK